MGIATAQPRQRSFDDLGTPLHEVTFVVVDVETTGASPRTAALTEIAAAKYRAGECLGTFQTLVDPGCPIPTPITMMTGITDDMVRRAPPTSSVLPAFLEFAREDVLVGHNLRFDLSFLNAALERSDRPRLANPTVDTLALARRLVRSEVPNCQLGTLAAVLGLEHRPTHRALDDVLATGDLLHRLIEQATGYGVLGLADLVELPKIAGHPQAAKLRLTRDLPRTPGVYWFENATGTILYVGKAVDVRARVRSYFTSDRRPKVGPLLRDMHRVGHVRCTGPLEAAVAESRIIQSLVPRYNRRGTRSHRGAYLTVTGPARTTRLAVTRVPDPATCGAVVGPFPSAGSARGVAELLATVFGIGPGPLGDTGDTGDHGPQRATADSLVRALGAEPAWVLEALAGHLVELARREHFEAAATARDRAAALAVAVNRQRRADALRGAGDVTVESTDGGRAMLRRGVLVATWDATGEPGTALTGAAAAPEPPDAEGPLPLTLTDELAVVGSWLDEQLRTGTAVVTAATRALRWPEGRLPRFRPSTAA